MNAQRAYKYLLRLYPRDYRATFASEMLAAFEQASQERQGYRFVLAELTGLLIGASSEWIAKLTSDSSVRGHVFPDRLRMRPPGVPWEVHYAGAFADWPTSVLTDEVAEAERRVKQLVDRIVHAIAHHDFEGARNCSREERQARDRLLLLRRKYQIGE
jgi:hypothetical protein